MNEDLKPCPFCGGTDLEILEIDEGFCAIACETCDAFGPMGMGHDGARQEWNHRVVEVDPY